MKTLQTLIEALTEEAIKEVLRKFNFAHFKTLGSPNLRIDYAKQQLPEMGVGSSRAVFALSGGKVLKIAINKAGYAQNQAEYDIYRDPRTAGVVTKIFDKDQTFSWLVSEIANPLKDVKQFEQLTGITFATYVDVIKTWNKANPKPNPDAFFQDLIGQWQDRLDDLADGHTSHQIYLITQRRVEQYKRASQSQFVRTMMMLVQESLSLGDVARIDDANNTTIGHYGYTADGRIVLLDYGFTREVADKHYDDEGHPLESNPETPPEDQPEEEPASLAGQQSQSQQPPPPAPDRDVRTARRG